MTKYQKRLLINDLVNAKSFETSSRLNLRKLSQKESLKEKPKEPAVKEKSATQKKESKK